MFRQSINVVSRRFQSSIAYNNAIKLIKSDLKASMLNKKNVEKNTIKLIISTIKDNEIDGSLQNEFALFKTFNKMIKQRQNSLEEYNKQNRKDLAEVEHQEIYIIRKYLSQLPVASTEELRQKLKDYLVSLKENEDQVEMNKVFKMMSKELAGEWRTSPELLKPLVPQVYKEVFKK